MKAKLFDELKESLTETLDHSRGKITLKTKRIPIPPPPKPLSAKQIVHIRKRIGASQAVFARMLNVARDTEISWEQGRRTPSGPALKLLSIAAEHPEQLIEA